MRIIVTTALLLFLWVGTASAQQLLAYVVNQSGSVSVIDTATNQVIRTIDLPNSGTITVAHTPDGKFIYVGNPVPPAENILVIRTDLNVVTDTIDVDAFGVVASPDGQFIYAVADQPTRLVVIRVSDNAVIDSLPLPGNLGLITLSPDGSTAYITSSSPNDVVFVVDTLTLSLVDTVPVGIDPFGIDVSPSGQYVYVANSNDIHASRIDTSDNSVIDIPSGLDTRNLVVSPNGLFVYLIDASGVVFVLETATNTIVDTITVGDLPQSADITPDGEFLYVTNTFGHDVSVVSTSNNTVIDTIPTEDRPTSFGNFIVLVPEPAPIPTLSEWGTIVMVGLIGIAGFIVIRRKKAQKPV